MLVLVIYDISTKDRAGSRRLNRVCKACLNRGVRVQNSAFECELDAEKYRIFKETLGTIIDPSRDRIRFYLLGNHYKSKIEVIGKSCETWDRESYVL